MDQHSNIDFSTIVPAVNLVVLVENTVNASGLYGEQGLSFWLETPDTQILFDTGQSDLILRNAHMLGVPLETLDVIALSHGHYDHSGGLQAVLNIAPEAQVLMHPDAMKAKFSRRGEGQYRDISMPHLDEAAIRRGGHELLYTGAPTVIRQGFYLTGPIPRATDFETTGGAFFQDVEGQRPDQLIDDQALFFEAPEGIVLILGCAHSGVVNTMHYVAELTRQNRFYCVMGGMHLKNATRNRLDETLQAFHDYDVQWIGLAHCTGTRAVAEFWTTFPGRCFTCPVGSQIAFGQSFGGIGGPWEYHI